MLIDYSKCEAPLIKEGGKAGFQVFLKSYIPQFKHYLGDYNITLPELYHALDHVGIRPCARIEMPNGRLYSVFARYEIEGLLNNIRGVNPMNAKIREMRQAEADKKAQEAEKEKAVNAQLKINFDNIPESLRRNLTKQDFIMEELKRRGL